MLGPPDWRQGISVKSKIENRNSKTRFRFSNFAFRFSVLVNRKQKTVSRQIGFGPRMRARPAKGGSLIKIK
jgi:hypothetical protein